jgi:glycosyltransferase involved in cell wall biosynthesis
MISVIIPTLNEEKIIEKTLKYLVSFKNDFEIIVSDGKSTDKTVEIAKKYADKVVTYEGITRQTIAMGRNLGAQVATGKYLVFMDADVTIPDINIFFNKTAGLFQKDKKLVGLSVFVKVFPEMSTFPDRFFFNIFNWSSYFLNNVLNKGSALGEFQMIRAEAFRKLNGYNEKIVVGEDVEMFSRLSLVGRVHTESSLFILHTSRRAHNIGWPSLLLKTIKNSFYLFFFKHSAFLEWEPIR